MGTNEMALNILKDKFGLNADLPGDIKFELSENSTQCRMKLNPQKMTKGNMQDNDKAFEAWAVAMHIALKEPGIIILDADGKIDGDHDEGKGHWHRFLYRALRFSEQYRWFRLSEKVEPSVRDFENYLENNYFTNNLPKGEAGIKEDIESENNMEAALADNKKIKDKLNCTDIYRQLPVGLFKLDKYNQNKKGKYSYDKNGAVFTGGKSAIDMWSWEADEFKVIELKAKNKMMGIITEIFFYSNYMYDFLVRDWDSFVLNGPSGYRGYSNILEHKGEFKKVCGIMLADEFHSIIEDERVLEVLNNNNMNDTLKYEKAIYNMVDYL